MSTITITIITTITIVIRIMITIIKVPPPDSLPRQRDNPQTGLDLQRRRRILSSPSKDSRSWTQTSLLHFLCTHPLQSLLSGIIKAALEIFERNHVPQISHLDPKVHTGSNYNPQFSTHISKSTGCLKIRYLKSDANSKSLTSNPSPKSTVPNPYLNCETSPS